MFQLTYSEPEDPPIAVADEETRLEIDLESLEKWVIANSSGRKLFSKLFPISPEDLLGLIHEAMYWRDQVHGAQEALAGSQGMSEDLFSIAEDNRKSAQTALKMI